jgi:hypothetical protein
MALAVERARCQQLADRGDQRLVRQHAVSTTIATAPTVVPTMRYHPLRSEAPRWGWHTIAAEVPAQ